MSSSASCATRSASVAEAGRGDQHPAGRVEDRRVLAGRDHDQVGPEGAHDRRDDLVEREQVAGVGGRGRERHVDRAALRARSSGRAQRAGVGGVPVLLVQGDREDVVAVPEDPLGAVGDVHVPVDDRHALDATGAGVLDAARHVVQVRRGDRPVGLGMVSGRASVHERPPDAAVEDRVDRGQHAADGQPGRVPRARRSPVRTRRPTGRPRTAARRRSRYSAVWTASSASSGAGTGAMRASALPSALRCDELVRLRGQRRLGDVRAAQREVPARDLHRRGRRIVGEDPRRVHVTQHDATILTRAPERRPLRRSSNRGFMRSR